MSKITSIILSIPANGILSIYSLYKLLTNVCQTFGTNNVICQTNGNNNIVSQISGNGSNNRVCQTNGNNNSVSQTSGNGNCNNQTIINNRQYDNNNQKINNSYCGSIRVTNTSDIYGSVIQNTNNIVSQTRGSNNIVCQTNDSNNIVCQTSGKKSVIQTNGKTIINNGSYNCNNQTINGIKTNGSYVISQSDGENTFITFG